MARTSEALTPAEITFVQQATLGVLVLPEQSSAPSTVAGAGQFYVKASDNDPYFKDSNGVETNILTSTSGAPINATYVTLTTNGSLTNERVLTGTADQVILTDNGAGSTIVLSLPQSIATNSAVTFGSVSTSGLLASATGLTLEETGVGTDIITLQAPSSIAASYTLTLPVDDGTSNQVLTTDGNGVLSWSTPSVFAYGASISGTTADGLTITLNNSSDDAAGALKLVAGNTQSNQPVLANLQIGTSGNVMGLLIQGTGGATGGAAGTGVNHLTLWGNTANNSGKVLSVGSETSYAERYALTARGATTITPVIAAGLTAFTTDMSGITGSNLATVLSTTSTMTADNNFLGWGGTMTLGATATNSALIDTVIAQTATTGINNRSIVSIEEDTTISSANTRTRSVPMFSLLRAGVTSNASANLTLSGAVLKLAQTYTQTSGTLAITGPVLELVQPSGATGEPLRLTQNNVTSTNYRKLSTESNTGISLWMGNGTDPNGNLSGTAGDFLINGGSNIPSICGGTTTWSQVVTLTGTQALTNKTLTAPKFADLGFIADANGNEMLVFDTVASAVPYLQISNNSTGLNPVLTGAGETNTGIDFLTSGTGTYRFLGNATQAAQIRLYEDTDDGSNFTAFKVGTQSADITYTLPTAVGASGAVLTDAAGNGTLSWAVPTGSSVPTVKVCTAFETSGRFSSTTVNGTATFGTAGLELNTTGASTSSASTILNTSSANNKTFTRSPKFTAMSVFPNAGAVTTGSMYVGMGEVTVNGSGHTFTTNHIGFKFLIVSSVCSLYATQGDGSTENASSALTTANTTDVFDLIAVVNGTSSVDYYWSKNGGALSSATNLTSNLPTATENTLIQCSLSNNATTQDNLAFVSAVSYER